MASKMEKPGKTFYFEIPQSDELKCIICEIDNRDIQNSKPNSYFHCKTMKCRSVIHNFSEVMTSPLPGENYRIYIIARSELVNSGELQHKLSTLYLSCNEPIHFTKDIYKICLKYTIQCKIDQRTWNRIEDFYVRRIDFSSSCEKMLDALQFTVSVVDDKKGKKMKLELQTARIRIQCVDFNEVLPKEQKIYVLPNMTEPKVLEYFKKIPAGHQFENYEQLRNHWKSMYGYYLPETEDGTIYYEVQFFNYPKRFLYPNICLIKEYKSFFEDTDDMSIIPQFVDDLKETVTEICGKRFVILQDEEHTPSCSSQQNSSRNVTPLSPRLFGYLSNMERNATLDAFNLTNNKCSSNVIRNAGSSVKTKRQSQENIETLESFYFEKKKSRCSQTKLKTLKEKMIFNGAQE